MATVIDNLMSFSRSLPEPFVGVNAKVTGITSKYGSGGFSTLSASVIKAINAVCRCRDGSYPGAVGLLDHRGVVEYKSRDPKTPDDYHIVVYDSSNGSFIASVYNADTENVSEYQLNKNGRDGAAILMAMYPFFMADQEFEENFNAYYDEYLKNFSDIDKAKSIAAILCDNVYRRLKDDKNAAHIKADNSGNVYRITQARLDSGDFIPKNVLAGEFTIFTKSGPAVIHKASSFIEHTDFVGKYTLSNRSYSAYEQALVPKLPSWYVIPDDVVDVCKHALATSGKPSQMRNFMFRGPAGTGKTMGAKAVAAGLGLPYMKFTCSAGTELYDFIGQIFPDTEGGSTGDPILDKELDTLRSMGGINYKNVKSIMNLPDLDDMDYDPEGVYKQLTGIDDPKASAQDCMAIVLDRVTDKVRALMKRDEKSVSQGQTFTYTETDFIKALKHGYVIEIQEPTTIIQPGVLVGLNSLLEQEGSITLPTGEIIERHPDAVVIVTTNVTYEGCRGLNQSLIDRMSLVKDIELPTSEVMVQRAMSVTGATDEQEVAKMVQVVNDMADFCRKNSITDGIVGMRSLIDWIVSAEITGNVYHSALNTVISKATANDEDREMLIVSVLEPIFAPNQKATA